MQPIPQADGAAAPRQEGALEQEEFVALTWSHLEVERDELVPQAPASQAQAAAEVVPPAEAIPEVQPKPQAAASQAHGRKPMRERMSFRYNEKNKQATQLRNEKVIFEFDYSIRYSEYYSDERSEKDRPRKGE